uniref:Uncharacterized protein n=1 Tax=viral metagenome TaxID=1070528 RepID=A0A6C0LI88_9ZZZZ
MSSVDEIKTEINSLIDEAEQLRDDQKYDEAMSVIGRANQRAMTSRNRDLIMKTMQLRTSIQQARLANPESSTVEDVSNRCMIPNPPTDLECCSDVYEAEESEVLKRLAANDGTIVVEYNVREDLKKYVCFNRSILKDPSRIRSQTIRLCSPISATTNSEMMYGYANNRVSTNKIKYVVKATDKIGDKITIDVPESDGSVSKLDVEIPKYINKYREPSDKGRLENEIERIVRELSEQDENQDNQSILMQLQDELQNAEDEMSQLENDRQVNTGELIYFKTPNIREGPAGSEELYIKLRFFGLDVGGVIDLKDFLYEVSGFPDVNRFVINQVSSENYLMLSNGLSVNQDVSQSYYDLSNNIDEALLHVVQQVVNEPDDSEDWEYTLNWVREQIDKTEEVYSGDDIIKKTASEAARSIKNAENEISQVTDALSASHCQLGQDTTVWKISPLNPKDVSTQEKEDAMSKVNEMYSTAQYKPVTLDYLKSKIVDILKEAYARPTDRFAELSEEGKLIDPDDIDLRPRVFNDSINEPNITHSEANDILDILGTGEGEAYPYDDVTDMHRGVAKLRCFIAQNVEINGSISAHELDRAAQAFNINDRDIPELTRDFLEPMTSLNEYLQHEYALMQAFPLSLEGHNVNPDTICENLSIDVDGGDSNWGGDNVSDPRNYNVIVSAFGNRLFADDDDEPSGEIERESGDEMDGNATNESVPDGFGDWFDSFENEQQSPRESYRPDYNSPDGSRGNSLHLSHLNDSVNDNDTVNDNETINDNGSDLLSEVGSLDSNDSINSLDLGDWEYDSPVTPSRNSSGFVEETPPPISLVPRISDGVTPERLDEDNE